VYGSVRSRLRSFARPVCAARMTAGPDEVRVSGPDQRSGLRCPDNASGCPGSGSARSSSLTLALSEGIELSGAGWSRSVLG